MAHPQEAQVGAAGGYPWFSDGSGMEWGLCPKTGRVRFHAACQVVENVTTAYPSFLHQMLSQTFRFHSLSPIVRYTLEFLMMFGLCGSCGSLYVLTGQNICGTPRGRAPGALRHVTQHQRLVGEV